MGVYSKVDSLFPQWFIDLATLTTVVGFFFTIWLLFEAKKIRNSFLRRARLPQITKKLSEVSKSLSSHLKNWTNEEREAIQQLSISRALLENVLPKLPEQEQKKCNAYIKKLTPKKWIFFNRDLPVLTEDSAWNLYTELSALTTTLIELEKDSKWD